MLLLWVKMRHVTLLGLLPRVFVEMAIGYSINLEVLDKMEVALKFVNYMEKIVLQSILQRINNVLLLKL